MLERYSNPKMASIWSEENKLRNWLEIEVLVCEALADLGEIPREAAREIRGKADFDLDRVKEIEGETHHDVIAFVKNVGEKVGEAGKYIHLGLTSSDLLDTGLALQIQQAGQVLLEAVEELQGALREQAQTHRYTLMMGRTHGVHAEPITFGLKLLVWLAEMERNEERLGQALKMNQVGKISGAVGTYANIDPQVEVYVCEKLNLQPARISTQILQRDRHAQFLTILALIGGSLDKMATELRNLQRTELLEVQEPFRKGQRGSSAMPHKKNPIVGERISGLARVLRGNALAAMENMALWHERDISHSSVERIIIPDSTSYLDYMLRQLAGVIGNLRVYPDHMKANLDKTRGLVFSQQVLLALVEKGVSREEAYTWVQELALRAWEEGQDFRTLLEWDHRIRGKLQPEELEGLFDYNYHLRHVDTIFARFEM